MDQFFRLQFQTPRKAHPKVKFTVEDDAKLKSLVETYGETDWNLISQKMETRNPRQCRERWENYLSPKVNHSPFTPAEDIQLLTLYEELGAKWVQISKRFNNRTDISVKSRWMVLKRRNITKESLLSQTAQSAQEIEDKDLQERSNNVDKIIKRLANIAEYSDDDWLLFEPNAVCF
ncbi:Myb-like DNA-binding domain containing protein [Trichomonas vaginalis G3]|uniref:Myb-like DNA-binding domain containing protein n=1 Tax=Trichomonas vaginalis (strain ATCC PRA-98 / G3) TaxID=412133 RepID=A2DL52_TRIV3|nr:RNA polymerase II transcription regulator recruiting protein [Trichomonas vaginalis G3]EAY18843.1 Myb-like DNA-binding domain containing protein [Trichomonas vaginalis G3]KAI5526051.1 RNA polymerase II transcription regulator recruiting protein [Trichomonas vaginalis G3]|eukprot:XP_001579829.1 Myb-like DNA-binding domain containing protein [Trichomonas vaginalis G3]